MGKREKRIESLRNAPNSVRPQELEQVLLDAGFKPRVGKGDHRNYSRGHRDFTIDFGQRPVKPIYVKKVLAMLDAIAAEAEEDDDA